MEKHNITGSMYVDDQWFISTDEVKIAAIRRDYLQKIHKIKDPNGKKARLIITLITSNGKKLKLAGSYDHMIMLKSSNIGICKKTALVLINNLKKINQSHRQHE